MKKFFRVNFKKESNETETTIVTVIDKETPSEIYNDIVTTINKYYPNSTVLLQEDITQQIEETKKWKF